MKTMLKKRYELIDTLRGMSLVSMIIYHFAWDCVYIFNIDWSFYHTVGAYIWQQSICWTFILISGFCWHFGRNKFKNGILIFGCGALITLITMLFMPKQTIYFGVLTLIGSSVLFMIPLDKVLKKISPVIGVITGFGLFTLFRNVNFGFLGFEKFNLIEIPQFLYRNYFTAYLGFPFQGFASTDYFSVLPWFFLFITGYFLYFIVINSSLKNILSYKILPLLNIPGKHTLGIYLIHQPVIYGLLYLVL